MNTTRTTRPQFNASSRLTRTLSATAALLCTVLVVSSVVGLALHYEHNAPMQAAALSTTSHG